MKRLGGEEKYDNERSNSNNEVLPSTYLVLQLEANTDEKTLHWLIEKLRGSKRNGCGELDVMKQCLNSNNEIILHISASKEKLLQIAEEMELPKLDKFGKLREFSVNQLEDFLSDGMHTDDLFTLTERQSMARYQMENIRALSKDEKIPGHPSYTLFEGESIVQACQRWGVVTKLYPLHDPDTLKALEKSWWRTTSFLTKQPIDKIREYFGETIAMYFAFLEFYTYALIIPTILGLLQLLISVESLTFFCIFNVVWVTFVLEIWKRKSNELAFNWNTIHMTSMDEPRPSFRGALGIDAITGKVQPQSPRYITYMKMYLVSIPIVFICMVLAFIAMLWSFWIEDFLKQSEDLQLYVMLPSIIYSILVSIVSIYYRKLATFLTEWENHRTQSQYDIHRVTKLVLFEFVNNFMSLFYIAFIVQDMENLRSQLQTMLIVSQAITNLQETIQPLAVKYYVTKVTNNSLETNAKPKMFENNVLSEVKLPQINADDPRIHQAVVEGQMEAYEGTYDDYLELYVQFGYVFLFSSVYPIAALWALGNNFLEIKADAYKLCKLHQRPISRKTKNIGAWQRSFEIMGALSILTNCGMLYLSPQVRSMGLQFSDVQWLLVFVLMEHVLLGIRFLLHITISDKPEWVRVALAKRAYKAKKALKSEMAHKIK